MEQYLNELYDLHCDKAVAKNSLLGKKERLTPRRYTVIYPENVFALPDTLSLTSMLYCSPQCLTTIKEMTYGRAAYIVPSTAGPEEVRLCAKVELPMLAADPMLTRHVACKHVARVVLAVDVKYNRGPCIFAPESPIIKIIGICIIEESSPVFNTLGAG